MSFLHNLPEFNASAVRRVTDCSVEGVCVVQKPILCLVFKMSELPQPVGKSEHVPTHPVHPF